MIEDDEVFEVFFKALRDQDIWIESWRVAVGIHIARLGCSPYGVVTTTFVAEVDAKLVDLVTRGFLRSELKQQWINYALAHGLLDTLARVSK